MLRTRTHRRALAVAIATLAAIVAGLVPGGLGAPAGAQENGGPEVPFATAADGAAAWLAAQFDANGTNWSAAEHADFIFALAATNGSRTRAVRSLELMETKTATYIQPTPTFTNFGGTAKVMLAAQTLAADVNDFAGFDLEAILRNGIVADGANAGQIGNSNTFTQPLGIMALARTDGGVPASTVDWLTSKQCPNGGFSWGNCSFADADYTGLAASALHAAGNTTDLAEAVTWLEANQSTDGGFGASNSPADSNTNSTGLAVQALRAAGAASSVVDAGADYVASVQYTDGPNAGAIPWKQGVASSLFLATTQGVLAWGAPTYAQLAFPTVVGEPCPPAQGVTVVLDLAHFDDTIQVACAEGPQASGTTALESAGFSIGWHPLYPGGGPDMGGAVCQIDGFPTAGYPTCWNVGFWSYWHARADAQWVFSNCGIDNRTPRQGSVEGWRYEPDWNNHWSAAPLIDAHWPQVTLTAPDELAPGETATIEVAVERTEPRTAPAPDEEPEPCYLPPETGPEDYTPTVTGPVTDGLVEVRVDGVAVGTPVPVAADGTISVDTVIPDGDHEVTAHFLGTATDLAAPSAATDVRVAPETTTALTADPTTATVGEEVELTATVAADSSTVDAGEVEFRADGQALGDPVAVDASGVATTTTAFDAVGEVAVTAHYLGSAAGRPSDSGPVTVTVELDDVGSLVRDLYLAVLGREPDPAGYDFWVGRLEAGTPPERLAESLARTREGWMQVVRQHYRLALSREGEADGVSFWTDRLQRTNQPDELLTMLFSTQEVFVARSGGTNPGYVTYLYSRVLDRAPEADGKAYWVNRLDTYTGQASMARHAAARALVFTAEGISRQVDANHKAVCGVPAPASARAELTAQFKASRLNPSTLRAAIVIRGCPD